MQASTATSLNFTEGAKSTTNTPNVFKMRRNYASLEVTLNRQDGEVLKPIDGVLAQFGSQYLSDDRVDDAEKLFNYDENFSMQRGDAYLSIERRGINREGDTIFLHIASFKKDNQYAFTINPAGFPLRVKAYIQDNYLGTESEVPLDKSSSVDFYVTADGGSYAPDRFRIVFRQAAIMAAKKATEIEAPVSIFPNPVTGKIITVQLSSLVKGAYRSGYLQCKGTTNGTGYPAT